MQGVHPLSLVETLNCPILSAHLHTYAFKLGLGVQKE